MGTQHNKLDSDGQRLRRYEIIRFIKDNGPVKASAVMERFGIKKQAFYDDLGEINIRGDVIVYTGKNMYAYNEDHHITGELLWKRPDKAHLRSWFALLCLSSKPSGMTAKELLDRFKEAGIRIGNTSANGYFYSLLLPLIKEGLIKKVEKGGTVRYVSDALRFVDSGKALAFLENAGKNDGRVRIESLGRIEEKIRTSFPDLQVLVKNGSVENGKKSVLTQEQSSFLRTLSDFGFTESAVDITYRTRGGSLRRCVFCTGLCVFDIDTGGLYLIGRSDDGYDTVIPADSVISVSAAGRDNPCFMSDYYLIIYGEMFQVSVGEPYDVKVRFENHPFILDKLRRLCSARTETADIEVSGSEIVYSDRIRGLEAFSRYLRRFGSSCIVECPDELRHMAERSAERLIERYAAEGGDL